MPDSHDIKRKRLSVLNEILADLNADYTSARAAAITNIREPIIHNYYTLKSEQIADSIARTKSDVLAIESDE